jgi:hypothetical protein
MKKIFSWFNKNKKEKEQLALGKFVWRNKESKIHSLNADVARLEKNVAALQASLKKEISMNAELLAGKGVKK